MKERKPTKKEFSLIDKIAATSVIIVIMIIVFFIVSIMFQDSTQESSGYTTCETRFDSTACPEPDYGPTGEQPRNTPDATPYDHPDDCGGYSCKQFEADFNEIEL